jgi:hypothetical protein
MRGMNFWSSSRAWKPSFERVWYKVGIHHTPRKGNLVSKRREGASILPRYGRVKVIEDGTYSIVKKELIFGLV